MRWNILVPLFCFLLIASPGSKKRETPQPVPRASQESNQAQIDVCGLLTKEEIEAIQGSPIKETKSSARSDAAFLVSQCFYTATEFSKSVSLAVMRAFGCGFSRFTVFLHCSRVRQICESQCDTTRSK